MIWAYERKGIPSCAGVPVQPTPQQLFECLERHPRLRQSVDAGGHQRSMFMLTRSQVMGLHYLFASVDREDADEFFRRLNTGEELSAGDPLFALRERFIRALSNTDKMRDIVVLAFTIRAWNAWRAGERLTKLQWKPGGAHPDRFPRIEGCQIALSEAGD